jgi:hypothetical protein
VINTAGAELPPDQEAVCDQVRSHYIGSDLLGLFPSGIDMSKARLHCFDNVVTIPLAQGEYTTFTATLEAVFDAGSGGQLVNLTGPVESLVYSRFPGDDVGSWSTEILSMSLSGDVGGIPIEIRESPVQPSLGQTSSNALGGGLYQIDSFFDVFIELSVAGGPFEPSLVAPGRITLERVSDGGVPQPTAALPPEPEPPNCDRLTSHYVGGGDLAQFPNGIDLGDLTLQCFQNVGVSTDPGTGDETQTFDAILETTLDDGSGPQVVLLTGPIQTIARGKGAATTGSWDTEILSMSLSGDVGGVAVDVRESPSLPSPGRTSVEAGSGADFVIDSFFDVFIELSIDGGPFQPQANSAARMELSRIPLTVTLASPELPAESDPPHCGRLKSHLVGAGLQALYPNGVSLEDVTYRCFRDVNRTTAPGSGDETESFDAVVEGTIDDGSGPQSLTLAGPVQTVARAKGGASTGSWETEILSLSLSGDVGGISIEIRESPGLPSPGRTRVADNGDGTFEIDSFFDVFTELSVDGGPFQPQTNSAGRIELQPIAPSVTLHSPSLPPESDPPNCDRLKSRYVGSGELAQFPNGVSSEAVIYRCFKSVSRSTDPGTGDETEMFDAVVEATVDDGTGPQVVLLTGPIQMITRAKGAATTGSWDTEILSMSLFGDVGGVPVDVRESPGLPSSGETSVVDNGDGTFQIESFFDVFLELSVAGGPFQPQTNGAGRIVLEPIRPSVDLPSADLPPEGDAPTCAALLSQYVGNEAQIVFPSGIDVIDLVYECFVSVSRSVDPPTGDETESFDATFSGIFDDGSGPQLVVLTGPVQTIARGKGGATTGSWDTEILSMSLSGDVGGVLIEIRESPSLPSPGRTTVLDNGDGTFEIDSFFDVFVELSVDGGPFQPQTSEAARLDLQPVTPTVILSGPGLPPEANPADCAQLTSAYLSSGLHAVYPNGIEISDPTYACFTNVATSIDPGTGDETESFDLVLEGFFDLGAGPVPTMLTGPGQFVTRGKGSSSTGTFQTEILSLSLSGDVGGFAVELRESPLAPSPGQVRVLDIGGGSYQIDSFFDVFTELSIDGGPFQPQTSEADRIQLIELPEPAQWLSLLSGAVLLQWIGRRRSRKRR